MSEIMNQSVFEDYTINKHHLKSILILKTPFNEEFIVELKSIVPFEERNWDENNKIWTVKQEYQNKMIELFKKHFREGALVEVKTDGSTESTNIMTGVKSCQMSLF